MSRPHILLITLDECRFDALSCYGGRVVATPNMDRVAAEGVRCDAAYAPSPLCLPSRYSLITGLYPHRHGAYSNFRKIILDAAVPNLYRTMGQAGYHVAHVGKCHYAPVPYGRTSKDQGMDDWPRARETALGLGIQELHLCEGKQANPNWPDDYAKDLQATDLERSFEQLRAATWNTTQSFVFPADGGWHADAWCAKRSIAVMERQSRERPLFLWCSFPGPHYPHDPPAEYLDRVDRSLLPLLRYHPGEFDGGDKIQGPAYHGTTFFGLVEGAHRDGGTKSLSDEDWRTVQAHYFACVALLDDWIGRMLAAAERALGSEVLVVITADHGDCMGAHRLWGKNRCAYEEVLRVPMLIRGPGFSGGQPSAARVNLIDLMPTLLQSAGVARDERAPRLDGRPLSDCFADGGHELQMASNETFLAIHDPRWKLIMDRESGMAELYDRQADPFEVRNRVRDPACRGELDRLRAAALDSFMDSALR